MAGTLRHLGMSIGLAISGSVFTISRSAGASKLAIQGQRADIVEELSTVSGFQDTMFVALVIAVIGLVFSVFRGRMPGSPR
jgi:hypothetical protein